MKEAFAVKAAILKDNKIFLLKRSSGDWFISAYDLPGGRKDGNESDEEALKREVKEEIGCEIRIIKFLNISEFEIPQKDVYLYCKNFLCELVSNNINLSREHESFIWIKKDDVHKSNIPNWIKKVIEEI